MFVYLERLGPAAVGHDINRLGWTRCLNALSVRKKRMNHTNVSNW